MASKKVSLITSLSLVFKDLKNEISKHFENSEKELKLVYKLIHTAIFQEPIDDSILKNDIQKAPRMLANYSYRGSDSSDYSRYRNFLQLGKADFQYPCSCNTVLFCIIITHDLFNSDSQNYSINRNSSYLDLSPLYESSDKDLAKVCAGDLDCLRPNTFANSRILIQLSGIGALLYLAITEANEKWINEEFKCILGTDNPDNIFNNIKQDKDGKFKDSNIADELIKGTEKIDAFGTNNTPSSLQIVEIIGIESARSLGIASLNDLHKSLNLVPYTSFENIIADKEVAAKLKTLYGNINNVKLYPGLMTEKTKPSNTINLAFAFPFTISCVPNKQLVREGVLHQLLLKNLPNCYSPNSAYAFYLFTVVELYPGLMTKKTKPSNTISSALALPFTISHDILLYPVNL
ncbi:4443_t:CDS:2, partial [Dentiscutata heterogama]